MRQFRFASTHKLYNVQKNFSTALWADSWNGAGAIYWHFGNRYGVCFNPDRNEVGQYQKIYIQTSDSILETMQFVQHVMMELLVRL